MEDELNILLDVDGVLANWGTLFISIAEREFNIKIVQHPDIWDFYEFPEVRPWKDAIMRHMISTPGLVQNMDLYPYAQDMVQALRKKGNVIACTDSAYPGPFATERVKWLMENFKFERDDIIFSRRKYLIDGWMLIDDKPSNVEKWVQHHPDSIGVLWHPPERDHKLDIEDQSIAHKILKTSNYEDLVPFL